MATNTTNYSFIKPDYADAVDIQNINDNMNSIDTIIKNRTDRITVLESQTLTPNRLVAFLNVSSLTVADASTTLVTNWGVSSNRGSWTAPATPNWYFNPPVDGYYRVYGNFMFNHVSATDGGCRVDLNVNTVIRSFSNQRFGATVNDATFGRLVNVSFDTEIALTTTSNLQFHVRQESTAASSGTLEGNSGSPTDATVWADCTHVCMQFLRSTA